MELFDSKLTQYVQILHQTKWLLVGVVLAVKIIEQLYQKITFVFAVNSVILKHQSIIHLIVAISYVKDINLVLINVFCKSKWNKSDKHD
jgi:hypothetical protein